MENVLIKNVNLIPEVEQFNASVLLQVGMLYKRGNIWSKPILNNYPGNVLFNGVTDVKSDNNNFILTYEGGSKKYLEATSEGIDYRLWNNASPDKATNVKLLVKGNPKRDLYNVNLTVNIEYLNDNTTLIRNLSTFNNELWENVQFNQELRTLGFQWYLHGVSGGDFAQGDFIANDNKLDFNTGNGDSRYCVITIDPNFPIANKAGIEDVNGNIVAAHYYLNYEKEVLDIGDEYLTLIAYTRTKKMHRGLVDNNHPDSDLNISLQQLFPNKKLTR